MTKLLEKALNAVRRLPPESQDEIARAISSWLSGGSRRTASSAFSSSFVIAPHLPLFASECTQPAIRPFAFAISFAVKKSSGFTLSTG